MSEDLVTWLRGELAADEGEYRQRDSMAFPGDWAFLLADIEAKRAILTRFQFSCDQGNTARVKGWAEELDSWEKIVGALWLCVRDLASAYRDRDGYREEWKP